MEGDTPQQAEARRRLGQALMSFMKEMTGVYLTDDDVMRRVHTEKFRREVERAAKAGVEVSLAWHSLATWVEEGKERIGYFSRALDALKAEVEKAGQPKSCHELWCRAHMIADCNYEIGRVHAHEGDPAVAREFLEKARSFIFAVDMAREGAIQDGVDVRDDNLEGRIATLLVQLPEEGEELDAAELEDDEEE